MTRVSRQSILLVAMFTFPTWAIGANVAPLSKSPPKPSRLHVGTCVLPMDPEDDASAALPAMCVRGQAGLVVQHSLGDTDVALLQGYAHGYAGAHLNDWLSAHAEGRASWLRTSPHQQVAEDWISETYPEQLNARVGNPATSRWRVTAGRLKLPFGVNLRPLPQVFEQWTSRHYWEGLPWGTHVTWDDQIDSTVEIAALGGPYARVTEGPRRTWYRGLAARVTRDLSALEGIRLIGSYYVEDGGERRVGFGLLNSNAAGDSTNIEIIRVRYTPDGLAKDDLQLIRVAFLGAVRNEQRWAVEYDDQSHLARMGTFGLDTIVVDRLWLRLAVSYNKSLLSDVKDFWVGTAGMEAAL